MNLEIDNLTSDKTSLILIFYESDSTPTDFDSSSNLKKEFHSKPDSRILISDSSENAINLMIKYNGDFDFVRNPPGPADANSGSKNSIVIAVCIILALLVVVFIGLFAFYWKKRKSREIMPDRANRSSGQNFMARLDSYFKSKKKTKVASNPYQTFDKKKVLENQKFKDNVRIFAGRIGPDSEMSEMSENSDYFRRNSLPGHLSNDSIDFGGGENIFTEIPNKSVSKLEKLDIRIRIDKKPNEQSGEIQNAIDEVQTENFKENNKEDNNNNHNHNNHNFDNHNKNATNISHNDTPLENIETARDTDSFLCYTDEEVLKNKSEKDTAKPKETDIFEQNLGLAEEKFEDKNGNIEFITRSKEVTNEENAPI